MYKRQIKFSASIIDLHPTVVVDTSGGAGGGGNGRFIIDSNNDANQAQTINTRREDEADGPRSDNPYIPTQNFLQPAFVSPLIAGLQGGTAIAGVSTISATDAQLTEVVAGAPVDAVAAILRLDSSLLGDTYVDFDMVAFINLTDAEIQVPKLNGVDLLIGNDTHGGLTNTLGVLEAHEIWVTLVPELLELPSPLRNELLIRSSAVDLFGQPFSRAGFLVAGESIYLVPNMRPQRVQDFTAVDISPDGQTLYTISPEHQLSLIHI